MPPARGLHPHPTRTIPSPNPNPNGTRCLLTARRPHKTKSPVLFPSSLPQSLSYSSSHATPSSLRSSRSNPIGYLSSMQGSKCPARYAVLGAGFAGLSVAWHLLKHSSKESRIGIDIYDEAGIGGGASGVSGGLLHPYSPKAKVLWRGAECWKECLQLLTSAERAVEAQISNNIAYDSSCDYDEPIVLRRGILRPATTEKNVEILKE